MALRAAFGAGVKPDDVGLDLVLLLGQSNMDGRGLAFDPTRFDPVDSRILACATPRRTADA